MTNPIRFTKMQGAGNDYIYVDTLSNTILDPSSTAIVWSNRHMGIGSDGLVLIGRSPIPEADFTMRIFNADGSEAMMCGNASRCIGKYVYEKGLTRKTQIRLLTLSGIKLIHLHVENEIVKSVTVDMGEPAFVSDGPLAAFEMRNEKVTVLDREFNATFVSMGNPHIVIFVHDVEDFDVERYGAMLECHPLFPERCNIEFAEMHPDGIRMRVWERGSGVTMACGTGACATAVAAAATQGAGRKSRIIMDGGTLEIEWCEADCSVEGISLQKNHVYMTGPAEFVFDGEIEQ